MKNSTIVVSPTPLVVPHYPPQIGTRCHQERGAGRRSSSLCSRLLFQRLPEKIFVKGFWILIFIHMLQYYLVDHDRTAGSLGFKEVFLVPKKVQNQI